MLSWGFFACLIIFCWKLDILNNTAWHQWSDSPSPLSPPPLSVYLLLLFAVCLFNDFWGTSSVKSIFFVMCCHWSLWLSSWLFVGSCRESSNRSHNVLWEWGSEGAYSAYSSCWQGANFCHDCLLWVFKATVELMREDKNRRVKMQQVLQFLLRFSPFSWISALWIAASLLLISRVRKKFSLAFNEGENFLKSLFC